MHWKESEWIYWKRENRKKQNKMKKRAFKRNNPNYLNLFFHDRFKLNLKLLIYIYIYMLKPNGQNRRINK